MKVPNVNYQPLSMKGSILNSKGKPIKTAVEKVYKQTLIEKEGISLEKIQPQNFIQKIKEFFGAERIAKKVAVKIAENENRINNLNNLKTFHLKRIEDLSSRKNEISKNMDLRVDSPRSQILESKLEIIFIDNHIAELNDKLVQLHNKLSNLGYKIGL